MAFAGPQIAQTTGIYRLSLHTDSKFSATRRNLGIDADELSSGRLLWSTTIAAKPLLAFDDRLVTQAEAYNPGSLPLVVFDSKTGERKLRKLHPTGGAAGQVYRWVGKPDPRLQRLRTKVCR